MESKTTPSLSKSRYLSGLQCHKKLWWEVHEPDAPELKPDENQLVIFDVGAQVGAAARERVPGGVLIVGKASEGSVKVEKTRRAIAEGAEVIYEATFEHDRVYASVDILERVGDGWRLTEVKSTVEAKEEHTPDVAVQTWVARGAELPVVASHLMHLNRECRAPDLSNLFARADLSGTVTQALPAVPAQVKGMLQILEGPLPDVAIGDHCDEPYQCPFKARCWPVRDPHHWESLPRLSAKKRAALTALGISTIHEIPADFELTDFQSRQREAVIAGRAVMTADFGASLKAYRAERVAFLDFETVRPAIPIWNGTGPYAQVPAQFSCHTRHSDGTIEHHEWIATTADDPRPGIAKAVVEACQGADVVVAFNASFERGCLQMLAGAVPEHAEALQQIVMRIKDLADPVKRGIYHPEFYGSYSLKAVVPALIPELAYSDLVVADGTTASNRLLSLMLNEPPLSEEERAKSRTELLAYCERDTWVMVKLLDKLIELAG
ncbi:MAG TPA: DUF2779 domain-containing protein [Gemmatimonadales bacterium]|nr:DUF2779 domain-containing protein [Gemmatimonadales bacterium]